MSDASHRPVRCGVVLAGGEGKRLRPLVQRLRGDALPKQYVNFIGTRSMLQHTFSRAEMLVPRDRLFTVISQHHLDYSEVRQQISGRSRGTVVVQPENKETGPGLLLPLMHLDKRYPDSSVAVFPSDHSIVEEDFFMAYVGLALRVIERDPSSIVLLGIEPDGPQPEYGYILPGTEVKHRGPWGIRKVLRFIEKPDLPAARSLILEGGLWNTMVMTFRVATLLDLVRRVYPELYTIFQRIRQAIGTHAEERVVKEAYQDVEVVNFSRALLETFSQDSASRLRVLPVPSVHWSDWGSEQRVAGVLRDMGHASRPHGIRAKKHYQKDTATFSRGDLNG